MSRYPAPGSGSAVPTVGAPSTWCAAKPAAEARHPSAGRGAQLGAYDDGGGLAMIADVAGWFGP